MSLAILRAELLTDPVAMGYAGKTDQQCLDLLTAKTRSRQRQLTTTDLLEWAGSLQRFLKIKNAAAVTTDSQTKNLAAILQTLLQSPGVALDVNRASSLALIDGLVSGAVLTAADKTALIAAATENIDRFTELGIPEYQLADVTRARSGTA
jgi:precorrin-4 methylase